MPRTVRNPRGAILNALATKNELTWTELWNKSTLSKSALSKYLDKLIKERYVETRVDISKRPPTTFYILAKVHPKEVKSLSYEEAENFWRQLIIFSIQTGQFISLLEDRAEAKKLLKEYLSFNLDNLWALTPIYIELAFAYSKGWARAKPKTKSEKQYEEFIRQFKSTYLKKYVEPWVESLAHVAFLNKDIAFGVREGGVYPHYGSEKGQKIDITYCDRIEELQKKVQKQSMKAL